MATRATYRISAGEQFIYFYIHYDSYPEGAADYFWQMHTIENWRVGYAGRFVRANDEANFTLSHETHGDTDYRYNLFGNGYLEVWEAQEGHLWKLIYGGDWCEFVNQYVPAVKKLYRFNFEECVQHKNTVMTLKEAKSYAQYLEGNPRQVKEDNPNRIREKEIAAEIYRQIAIIEKSSS